ncbi:MAG: hypothetical protein AAFP83_21600, partial [Bacteroidota bacterium]
SQTIRPSALHRTEEIYDADTLFYRTFHTMLTLREPTGVYRDATEFVESQYHGASTALQVWASFRLSAACFGGERSGVQWKSMHSLGERRKPSNKKAKESTPLPTA